MVTINMIFFTITIAKRAKGQDERARDAHIFHMMEAAREKRDEYTRLLP